MLRVRRRSQVFLPPYKLVLLTVLRKLAELFVSELGNDLGRHALIVHRHMLIDYSAKIQNRPRKSKRSVSGSSQPGNWLEVSFCSPARAESTRYFFPCSFKTSTVLATVSRSQTSGTPAFAYKASLVARSWAAVDGERISTTRSGAPSMKSSRMILARAFETKMRSGCTAVSGLRRTSSGATATSPSRLLRTKGPRLRDKFCRTN